jgi:hypothetical protein
MLFAMLTLFLPQDFFGSLATHPLIRRVTGDEWRRVAWRVAWAMVAVAVTLCVLAMLTIEVDAGASPSVWVRRIGMLLWMPYAGALLGALLLGWQAASRGMRPGELLNVHRSPAVVLLFLFALNGMAPYLGFQTVRTMSMFSNLRTEGGRTNHVFIPSSLQVADYQDDLVRLVASSDPWLEFYARNKSLLPFTELRRRAWENPAVPVQVVYERDKRIETLDTARPGAERQVAPLTRPLNKILAFREVDQDGQPLRCLW